MRNSSKTRKHSSTTEEDDVASVESGGGSSVSGVDDSSGKLSSQPTTMNGEKSATSESSTLARAETLAVNRSKMLVLLVLTLAAIGVGIATYLFTKQTETHEFESKFHDFAIEVEELVHDEARDVFLTIENLATIITSEAIATRANWPIYSIPHFEIRGTELNVLANSLMVAFSPLVQEADREKWEIFANYRQTWIQEGVDFNEELHKDYRWEMEHLEPIHPTIYRTNSSAFSADHGAFHMDPNATRIPDDGPGPYLPVWQQAPAPHDPHVIHYNLLRHEVFNRVFHGMNETLSPVLSEATDLEFFYGGSIRDDVDHPHSFLLQPVFEDFNETHRRDASHIMGVAIAILPWDHYFENILPSEAHGVIIVMKDTCGGEFSYQVNGAEAIFLGYGDFHDPAYTHLEEQALFAPFQRLNFSEAHTHCEYDLHIYPSLELEEDYRTSKPIVYAFLVVGVFLVTAMVFVLYDYLVQLRQNKVSLAAKKSHAVVASLFPKNVRDRIMADVEEQLLENDGKLTKSTKVRLGAMPKSELKNFLDDGVANADGVPFDTKPIADLFLSTTIMFGDIAGFTAWSSVREPSQVFTLLETLYHAFDETAKRRRVFKVETIGDCYVAVAGLPEPRKDHAAVMARFARDCIGAMNDLTKKLEVSLGPDTGELSMRVGLHSGPVTAGVLRGDKSRFQLFGDTVNTAARMESNGVNNRIHVSRETADLLKLAGKGHWIVPRKDLIEAKGKGKLQTFFLDIKKQSSGSHTSARSANSSEEDALDMPHLDPMCGPTPDTVPPHLKRKIQWNADILLRMLKQIVARRNAEKKFGVDHALKRQSLHDSSKGQAARIDDSSKRHHTVLDEVAEIIVLPDFNAEVIKNEDDPRKIELSDEVVRQLQEYVTVIASLYHHDNPFHNFEHASHVTMSVVKLLTRIVAPEDVLKEEDDDVVDKRLHDYTFGITSDPLTQFACAFSALIHDVDHQGVPNTQLIKEKFDISAIYRDQSVAEQNSVDLAWALLMEDNFKDLRDVIYETEDERQHFRQLVVNVVLATDICDAELKALRNGRWAKAFSGEEPQTELEVTAAVNRKATIVLEHIIQASDVAHTMQHWHIYRKWNENFFRENMKAYRSGRAEKDPSTYWYQGELGFFDYYIIPLAKKLKECGVFGVSSDEYLNYAMSNRREWEANGKAVVAEMSAKFLPELIEEDEEVEQFEDELISSEDNNDTTNHLLTESSLKRSIRASQNRKQDIIPTTPSGRVLKMEEFEDEGTSTELIAPLSAHALSA
ncbi:Receptor-type guanylate cyclase gcy [Seminavis robusta]|uniref:Receptor-type guanylate cyclase gcy n=1 Tax=Seminavis robusta TaxID=568900 RepID=A0A9N8DB25_9STRA|nr:Receptor-type guanylate cyclase gcy [Seminavis robusta]|eukprot:Sro16_g011760.1 Receptor-type guanylate cyclase gcy (1269) ;mRNA; r:95507-101409